MGVLGLVVVAWGLLVAPLTHAFTHGHGHSHGALPVQGEQHGAGSLEHLLALATAAPAVPQLSRVSTSSQPAEARSPEAPFVESWNRVEEPQGP